MSYDMTARWQMKGSYYLNYYWKEGVPKGWGESCSGGGGERFRIVGDPYNKRFSIEKFVDEAFTGIVYDSALFDFRLLKPEQQATWEKQLLEEKGDAMSFLLRDHNGRAIVIEEYQFKGHLCVECRSLHPQGTLISMQKMFYEELGDGCNGALLLDREGRPIVFKRYDVDTATGEFTELLEENRAVTPIAKLPFTAPFAWHSDQRSLS